MPAIMFRGPFLPQQSPRRFRSQVLELIVLASCMPLYHMLLASLCCGHRLAESSSNFRFRSGGLFCLYPTLQN